MRCQALAVATGIAEEDSSARPDLSDSTQTAAEPSSNQALSKVSKQHVRLDIQAPDTKKLLVAAVPLPEARSKVRHVTMSGLLHAQAVMCLAVLALKQCTLCRCLHVVSK